MKYDSRKATHSLPVIFDTYEACEKYIEQCERYSWGYPRVADMAGDGTQRYAPLVQYRD